MTDDDTRKRAQRDSALRLAALTVLLDRAGGSLSFTEAEYQAIADRFGGRANLVVHLEIVQRGDAPPTIEVKLLDRPPRQGDLVS